MSGKTPEKDTQREKAMRGIFRLLFACTAVGGTSAAQALPIVSVVPASSSVVAGQSVAVDVRVSGLDNELIGAYDLSLGWDPSLLSLTSAAFGDFLDGPADSLSGTDAATGSLGIFEVSLGALANQTGSGAFSLFSLSFMTLQSGAASIFFPGAGVELLSNEIGEPYAEFSLVGALLSIEAPPTPVPEPSILALFVSGVFAVRATRRRAYRHAA
jgi:hypothetical protein